MNEHATTIEEDWETVRQELGRWQFADEALARLYAQYEADQATMAGHAQCEANMDDQHEEDQEIIRAARGGMFNARQQLRGLRGVALRNLEAQISHVIEDLKATAVRCGEELRYLDQHEEGFRWLEDEPTFVPGQSPANRR